MLYVAWPVRHGFPEQGTAFLFMAEGTDNRGSGKENGRGQEKDTQFIFVGNETGNNKEK